MASRPFALSGLLVAGMGLASHTASAGTRTWDFTDGLADGLEIFSNTANPLRTEGGVDGSGYLAITDAQNSKYGAVVFPDIDGGKPIAAFTLECDVRIGSATGNGGRPADGMAVSYARGGDPLLVAADANAGNPAFNLQGSFSVPGGPEMGASTGVVVSFDTWAGNAYKDGSTDVEGLMIQVDGKVVKKFSMPTRNGTCEDITSLETGLWTTETQGNPDVLCWTKLRVNVALDGKLTVSYKNTDIIKDLQTTFFPSAGRIVFSGRTGGANAIQHVDNVVLTTIPADRILTGAAIDNAFDYRVIITDNVATGSILDPNSVAFTFDGAAATPKSSSKLGDDTTYSFSVPFTSPLAPGSQHTIVITAKDTNGQDASSARVGVVPNYLAIPASYASGIDAGTAERGWKYRAQWQKGLNRGPGDDNRTWNAERQINEAFLDVAGVPLLNDADMSAADENGYVALDGVVNFDQAAARQGNFGGETVFPGMAAGDNNSFTVELSGYVELAPGAYRFGVNSDDGFKHTFGRGVSDLFGIKVGEWDGGRGASDSTYDVVVTEAGLYPIRILNWEGGGGANLEIFTVTTDGVRHLMNDDADAASIKMYRSGLAKSHIRQLSPVPDQFGGVRAESPIVIQVVDGVSSIGEITVSVDGVKTSGAVSKTGSVTTFRIDYPNGQNPGTHVVNVKVDDIDTTYKFNVAFLPIARGAANFTIEAEDFDNAGSNVSPDVNIMPYNGGALAGQDAILNQDFFDNDGNDSDKYRAENGGVQKVNITEQGNVNDQNQANRGSWDMTSNWRIGWIGGDNWYNYHRTVPAGDYTVYAGLSFDGQSAGQLNARLVSVDGDNNPSALLGTFTGQGSGGWGQNNLVALADASGSRVVYTSDGTEKTFRFLANSGDVDYLAFVPVDGIVVASSPTSVVEATAVLGFKLVGAVDKTGISLTVDGAVVASVTADIANGVTVKATPATTWGAAASSHTYALTYKDTLGTSYVKSGSFKVSDGTFIIEAEDYNFGRGQTLPEVSTMPYYGGGFALVADGAVQSIDVRNSDGFDSNVYRKEENQDGSPSNININDNLGGLLGRNHPGLWDLTANYKIGWIGGGDWHNYTRTFPAGNYEVWAGLSFDNNDQGSLNGSMQRVTGDITQPNQEVEQLGTFLGQGTASIGGWGANRLVQLQNNGAPAIVSLSGTQTVRVTLNSGDFDFVKLVPTSKSKISIVNNGNGTVTVSWIGAGGLQSSTVVEGPYNPLGGAANNKITLTLPANGNLFLSIGNP